MVNKYKAGDEVCYLYNEWGKLKRSSSDTLLVSGEVKNVYKVTFSKQEYKKYLQKKAEKMTTKIMKEKVKKLYSADSNVIEYFYTLKIEDSQRMCLEDLYNLGYKFYNYQIKKFLGLFCVNTIPEEILMLNKRNKNGKFS